MFLVKQIDLIFFGSCKSENQGNHYFLPFKVVQLSSNQNNNKKMLLLLSHRGNYVIDDDDDDYCYQYYYDYYFYYKIIHSKQNIL